MESVKFALVIHNHQPVGNPTSVIEEVFKKAYLPFIQVLEEHPHIKVGLHLSGFLLDWLEKAHPHYLKTIAKLVRAQRIEILTGTYYEAILPIIPAVDRLSQIKVYSQRLEKTFDMKPSGMWVAERVWEPHLPSSLAQVGVKYTLLDDNIFLSAGLAENQLSGFYTTEDEGYCIKVLPILKRLRYLIPFENPGKAIRYLKSLRNVFGQNIAVLGDDGEKFGMWPGTYRRVYHEGWLKRFFHLLEHNRKWLHMVTPSEYLAEAKPVGRVYLPAASYDEMMEWALPAEARIEFEDLMKKLSDEGERSWLHFLNGGFWRGFLSKYPEANNIHKKMLHVSGIVHRLPESKLHEALCHLWMGQCNDAYWHGVFGGLYLSHLRAAVYSHLVYAEYLAEKELRGKKAWIDERRFDFDGNSYDELLIESDIYNAFIDPNIGGSLFELDYKPKAVNLLDVLSRWRESYHRQVIELAHRGLERGRKVRTIHDLKTLKQRGLEKLLIYDRYRRVSLLDHFLSPDTNLLGFASGDYQELGDFVQGGYHLDVKRDGKRIITHLSRLGKINGRKVSLRKDLSIGSGSSLIQVGYGIQNQEGNLHSVFGIEFNLSSLGLNRQRILLSGSKGRSLKPLTRFVDARGINGAKIRYPESGLEAGFTFQPACDLWCFPIEVVSQSEEGFEKSLQGFCILPHWAIDLESQLECNNRLTISIN